jgi:hypothetical protein
MSSALLRKRHKRFTIVIRAGQMGQIRYKPNGLSDGRTYAAHFSNRAPGPAILHSPPMSLRRPNPIGEPECKSSFARSAAVSMRPTPPSRLWHPHASSSSGSMYSALTSPLVLLVLGLAFLVALAFASAFGGHPLCGVARVARPLEPRRSPAWPAPPRGSSSRTRWPRSSRSCTRPSRRPAPRWTSTKRSSSSSSARRIPSRPSRKSAS